MSRNKVAVIREDGVSEGINFDGRFSVSWCKGVAFFLLGWHAEEKLDEESGEVELERCDGQVVGVMVGDDRRHIIEVADLTEIKEGEYCPSCGQIGCGHI